MILVPMSMKGGTSTLMPLSITADLKDGAAVWPRVTGSHSATVECHLLRQLDADGAALMELHENLHAVLQEGCLVAHEIRLEFDLLEGFGIHEGERFAVGVEELEVLLLEMDLVEGFAGAEALVEFGAGQDVLELDLVIGAALPRLHDLVLHRHPQRALIFEHHAGSDFIACDLGHGGRAPRRGGKRWVGSKERAGSSRGWGGSAIGEACRWCQQRTPKLP